MLKSLKSTNCRRQRQAMSRHHRLVSLDNTDCINFADNDYLGLSQATEVKQALAEAAQQWGLGSGASALVCGHHPLHKAFEQQFSNHVGTESSLYLSSGYHANLAVFNACSDRSTHVIADKHIHASLLDGIRLSRAKLHRYPHQSIPACTQLLQQYPNSLLVTESIFSMDGSVSDLKMLNQKAKQYNSRLIIDDAHGFGVLQSPIHACDQLIARITPLGKALGSCGAMISGCKDLIDSLVQHARSYRYTTALPPAIAAASSQALNLLQQQSWRQEKLHANICHFNNLAKQLELPIINTTASAIKSIIIGDNQTCIDWQHQLTQQHLFVAAIRPPTVEHGTARLRISLSSLHNSQHIERLLTAIRRLFDAHS